MIGITWLTPAIKGKTSPATNINQSIDSKSELDLAYDYYEGNGIQKDDKKSYEFALSAAKKGDPYAFHFLGDFYYFGHGVSQDFELAFKNYKVAADHSIPESMYMIGIMYLWAWNKARLCTGFIPSQACCQSKRWDSREAFRFYVF